MAFSKRFACIIICVILCVTICGCDAVSSLFEEKQVGMVEDTSLGYTHVDDSGFVPSPYYQPIKNRESYSYLSDDMKQLYDKLYDYVHYVYPKATADKEYKTKQVVIADTLMTESDVRLTIKALTDDNPQIFWLSTTFGYLLNKNENYTAVQLYSKVSPDTLADSITKLKTTVNSFLETLRDNMSPYELELLIHDYILATCSYDKTVEVDDSGLPQELTNSFDAYGALVCQKAVCEGYARAFQLLCNSAGIKCLNIIGESQGELHMWNAVELDGDYYYVDITWDDSDDKALKYDYLNINEKQLLYDHEFSKLASEMTDEEICGDGKLNALTSNFTIPSCTELAYNYYIRSASKLINYSGDNLIENLQTAAENKDEYFHVYLDPDEFTYDYAVDKLFFSYPQYFFSYVDIVNSKLPDYSIDVNNMSIFQKKQLSVVTVVLNYI